jgi:ribosomal 50S subunit-recycling heat shock protein
VRLDQFLKASRLVLRRTVAQALCAAGAVEVDGVVARASRTIRIGDRITLNRGERMISVRVVSLPVTKQTSRRDAATLYEVLSDAESPVVD